MSISTIRVTSWQRPRRYMYTAVHAAYPVRFRGFESFGFAVHRAVGSAYRWVVTNTETGLAIGPGGYGQADAIMAAADGLRGVGYCFVAAAISDAIADGCCPPVSAPRGVWVARNVPDWRRAFRVWPACIWMMRTGHRSTWLARRVWRYGVRQWAA